VEGELIVKSTKGDHHSLEGIKGEDDCKKVLFLQTNLSN